MVMLQYAIIIRGDETMSENEQIRELKNQYLREWRRKNPERAAEIQRRYWRKKLEQAQQAEEIRCAMAADNAEK